MSESDEDIREYEAELMDELEEPEETQNIDYEIVKEEVEQVDRKLPKKERLIQSIEKFRPYMADMLPTPNKLKKTKIVDLEKILARCISVSAGLNMKPEHEEVNDPNITEPTGGALPIPTAPPRKTGAETLYMANLGIVSVLEQVSRQTSDITGVQLEGWSDDIKRDKEQLVAILEGVYAENMEVVNTYMSPTSVWCLYMLSSGAGHLKPVAPAS